MWQPRARSDFLRALSHPCLTHSIFRTIIALCYSSLRVLLRCFFPFPPNLSTSTCKLLPLLQGPICPITSMKLSVYLWLATYNALRTPSQSGLGYDWNFTQPAIDHKSCSPTHLGLPDWSVTSALYTFSRLNPGSPFPLWFFVLLFVLAFVCFLSSDLGPALWNVYPEWSQASKDYVPGTCSLVSGTVALEDTVPTPYWGSPPSKRCLCEESSYSFLGNSSLWYFFLFSSKI